MTVGNWVQYTGIVLYGILSKCRFVVSKVKHLLHMYVQMLQQ